jgi:hypothetical protein
MVADNFREQLVLTVCDDHYREMGPEHVAREWPIHGIPSSHRGGGGGGGGGGDIPTPDSPSP